MNKTLATTAENGVYHGSFERAPGYCSRFGRQLTAVVYGDKYDALWRGGQHANTADERNRDATAARAAHRFLAAGLGFLYEDRAGHGGIQVGDILFKTEVAPNRWGDFSGHVGVEMLDLLRVAENSSTQTGRIRGALGFRTNAQWGSPNIVVRLPDPRAVMAPLAPIVVAPAPRAWTMNDKPIAGASFENRRLVAPVAEVLLMLHLQYDANAITAEGGNLHVWQEVAK